MKRLWIGLCIMLLFAVPLAVSAQGGGDDDDDDSTPPENLIEYGASVSGEITNREFEQIYVFEGVEGDVVVITMSRANEVDGLDPYLYLTTDDNELLAQNDDASSVDSRIVYRLPSDGIYQIVATRLGDRTGTSAGEYVLDLEKPPVSTTGVVIEGTLLSRDASNFHVIVPEEDGLYTITYKHVSGNYYPNILVQSLTEGDYYYEEIATLTGQELQGGSLTFTLTADRIYILSTQENYYDYDDTTNRRAVYTFEVALAE